MLLIWQSLLLGMPVTPVDEVLIHRFFFIFKKYKKYKKYDRIVLSIYCFYLTLVKVHGVVATTHGEILCGYERIWLVYIIGRLLYDILQQINSALVAYSLVYL